MKSEYIEIIRSKNLQDSLSWIDEISYSKKCEILNDLLETYSVEDINYALYNYESKYIKKHRVISHMIKNLLIYFCREHKKKEEEKNASN